MDTVLTVILWGGLFFLMMRFGCGSHMFGQRHGTKNEGDATPRHGGGCCGPGSKKKADSPSKKDQLHWDPPEQDTDPVCGKTVFPDAAKSTVHGGLVYYFCSRECREKFEDDPGTYLIEEPPAT